MALGERQLRRGCWRIRYGRDSVFRLICIAGTPAFRGDAVETPEVISEEEAKAIARRVGKPTSTDTMPTFSACGRTAPTCGL